METLELKTKIHNYIDSLESHKLRIIYEMLFLKENNDTVDFWETLSESEKIAVNRGIADLDEGRMRDFDKRNK